MSSDPIHLARRGLMLVLSSPSGAGKSTLARLLLSEEDDLILSISVTTRQRRASEVDGQHYHFIDEAAFLRMREHGELLESAEVHGNFYGTPREPVEKALAQGQDVLFDIDWQGAEQLAANEAHAGDVVRVFVLPPNFRELKARLERRAEDSSESIQRRLTNAYAEIGKWGEYDYVLVNEDLGESFPLLRAILRAERVRRERVVGLEGFVDGLLKEADATVHATEPEPAGEAGGAESEAGGEQPGET
jgi:guanylate kinase